MYSISQSALGLSWHLFFPFWQVSSSCLVSPSCLVYQWHQWVCCSEACSFVHLRDCYQLLPSQVIYCTIKNKTAFTKIGCSFNFQFKNFSFNVFFLIQLCWKYLPEKQNVKIWEKLLTWWKQSGTLHCVSCIEHFTRLLVYTADSNVRQLCSLPSVVTLFIFCQYHHFAVTFMSFNRDLYIFLDLYISRTFNFFDVNGINTHLCEHCILVSLQAAQVILQSSIWKLTT